MKDVKSLVLRRVEKLFILSSSLLLLFSFVFNTAAQTGGTFQIEISTVASGGGANSGGGFALASTAGQSLAGNNPQGGRFSVQSGFWTFNLAPTAARVSIGGRVTTSDGQGIRGASVMLTDSNGEVRFISTGSFGYYRFNEVTVGETYVLTVFSRRFVFANPTQIVTVNDEVGNLDFIASGQ